MIDQAQADRMARRIVAAYRSGDFATAERTLRGEPFRRLCLDLCCTVGYARRMLRYQAAQLDSLPPAQTPPDRSHRI